jgi:flagellar biosynthesis protein FlhB
MSDAAADDDTDKEFAPTQKRLEDARRRGDFARSPDLISAAALAGFVLAILAFGPTALIKSATAAMAVIDRPADFGSVLQGDGPLVLGTVFLAIVQPLAVFFLLPGAVALLAVAATRGFVISGEKLAPKLSKISPIATAKQKFGLDGLFEFGKSTLKLVLMSLVLYFFALHAFDDILASHALAAAQGAQLLLRYLILFIMVAFAISLVLGAADFGWQIYRHHERNRMSRKELLDETKDTEGDPHVKGQRRLRAQELATKQMLADVAGADVIIVNPTHYAVALKWRRGSRTAPICVAKGVDEIAAQIRARAAEHAVPIHRDPPTARAIHATVKLGDPIRSEHFKAVAAAIRFAEAMRAKARASWEVT